MWIDFKELREQLDFQAVLKHYAVELRIKGKQHQGFCPLPTHSGQHRSPSFSANLERKVWQCFGCGAKGNLLDFAVRMEGLDPENGEHVRKVALELQERFLDNKQQNEGTTRKKPETPPAPSADKDVGAAAPADSRPRKVNAPLAFELKELDATHPYLTDRGFTAETIAHFGLGYCNRGLMKGRIAIPLQDGGGALIGYAGRLVDESQVGADHPKYRFPSEREHEGTVFEFHKSLFVYNGHRLQRPVDDLVVVEGFPSVWWLWQHGFRSMVALMGAACSDTQATLIVGSTHPRGRVWILPDGDDAGARCAESILVRVTPYRFARWVKLGRGKQPTDCSPKELSELLEWEGGEEQRV